MVFYHSFRETSVSQEFGRGGRDSEHFRYGECGSIRTGLTEMLNIEHQIERENLEAIPSRSFIGKKHKSFHRQTHFQVQTRASAKSRSATASLTKLNPNANPFIAAASLTKLNPNANPFIPKPIEWEKLPLSPLDTSLSPSFDLDFNEKSVRSSIDEVGSFDSTDVLFMQPYPMDVSLQKTRGLSFSEYEARDQQQISGVDRHIFRDSAMVDNHDKMHNFPNVRENMNYTETKCYHCGCVGHMAVECYIKKQGFDVVCFQCLGTGTGHTKCPKTPKKEEFGIGEIESPVMYKSDCLNEDRTLKGHPAKLGKFDIGGRTWSRNSKLGQLRTLENDRLFNQILAPKI